jgi:hypothetical protein
VKRIVFQGIPNLADRSYFDPLTLENNGLLPENSNEKGRLWNSQNMGPENPNAGWRQKRRAAICERHSRKTCRTHAAGEWGCSRQSCGMDLNASIVIFAIPSIFRGH